MTRTVAAIVLVAAVAGPWCFLLGTNALFGEPDTIHRPDRCTRHCHDHGCHHDPVLPDLLTSDHGLYGWTIRALYAAGDNTGLDRSTGYGLANLVVFCVLWPGLMLALLAIGLIQRVRIRELRRGR